jgi:hypothetical protein
MSSAIYISVLFFTLLSALLCADLLSQLAPKTNIHPTHNPGSEQPQRVTFNTGSDDDPEARLG